MKSDPTSIHSKLEKVTSIRRKYSEPENPFNDTTNSCSLGRGKSQSCSPTELCYESVSTNYLEKPKKMSHKSKSKKPLKTPPLSPKGRPRKDLSESNISKSEFGDLLMSPSDPNLVIPWAVDLNEDSKNPIKKNNFSTVRRINSSSSSDDFRVNYVPSSLVKRAALFQVNEDDSSVDDFVHKTTSNRRTSGKNPPSFSIKDLTQQKDKRYESIARIFKNNY